MIHQRGGPVQVTLSGEFVIQPHLVESDLLLSLTTTGMSKQIETAVDVVSGIRTTPAHCGVILVESGALSLCWDQIQIISPLPLTEVPWFQVLKVHGSATLCLTTDIDLCTTCTPGLVI